MKKLLSFSVLLVIANFALLFVAHDGWTQDSNKESDALNKSLVMHASFDGTADLKLFSKDKSIYTADSTARKSLEKGINCKGVSIAKGEGISGDCLRFAAKTKEMLFYKATESAGIFPGKDWEGTVSMWLRLDPEKLEPGYCDPIQITQRSWNDAAFFVDFDKTTPRTFRLGAFPDLKHWNPTNTKWETISESERPMVTVRKMPFAADKWTHVAFTYSNINSSKSENAGEATLYLNGKKQGSIKRKFQYNWTKTDGSKMPVIMLGVAYTGDIDELMIFKKSLSENEIGLIYRKFSTK